MKTIKFEGKQYEVEDWALWAAKDSDGEAWYFSVKPIVTSDGWYLPNYFKNSVCFIDQLEPDNWQDSLTEV